MLDLEQVQKSANPNFSYSSIGDVLSAFVPYIFGIAGILLLLYLIYGGLGFMLSGGDPKAIESAKGKITNALVGFVIIFISFWIVQLVGKFLGLDVFGNIFG